MKINAAIIGSGIGIKHLEAINKYKNQKFLFYTKKINQKYLNIKVVGFFIILFDQSIITYLYLLLMKTFQIKHKNKINVFKVSIDKFYHNF